MQAHRLVAERALVADSDLARGLLADIEARRDALRASVATAEGELATKETEHLDLVTQAIQGFDVVGPRDPEGGGNADGDPTVKGFSPGEEWLPLLDSNQRHSD